jgi:hypothetical protein
LNFAAGIWGKKDPVAKARVPEIDFIDMSSNRRRNFIQARDSMSYALFSFLVFLCFKNPMTNFIKAANTNAKNKIYTVKLYKNLMTHDANVFWYKGFLADLLSNNLYLANLHGKFSVYKQFLLFLSILCQLKKFLNAIVSRKFLFCFFSVYEIFFSLLYLPARLLDLFFYKEKFFVYNSTSTYSFYLANAYSIPFRSSKMILYFR